MATSRFCVAYTLARNIVAEKKSRPKINKNTELDFLMIEYSGVGINGIE